MVDREIPIEVIGTIEEVTDVISLTPHVDIHQLAEQLTRQGGKFKLKDCKTQGRPQVKLFSFHSYSLFSNGVELAGTF